MIQGDQESTAPERDPLGIMIHIMGWIGRIFLVLIGLWVIFELFWYRVFTYALILTMTLVIVVSLLEKLNLRPANKEIVLHEEKSANRKLMYYLLMVPLAFVMAGFGLYAVLVFIFTLYEILRQDPVLLIMSLTVTPIIILVFNWLLNLKRRSK